MLETLVLPLQPKRYIVSVGKKVLLVTHDYRFAITIENDLIRRKITDESFAVVISKK
jgi:hypothetical protein